MKNLAIFAIAFAIGAAVTAHAAPAAKPAATKGSNDCPINVDSDKFTADLNAKTGTYSGNVIVRQCDTKLRADTVRISTLNNQADKVTASGNVVVDSPTSGTVTGDNGVYDVVQRSINLTGHVVLTKQKNSMRGAQMTVNLVTGIATLGGGAPAAPGAATSPGRVQGIFTPANKASTGN